MQELACAAGASVCISLPTLDADLARKIEPTVAPPRRRLRAVRMLADAGIRVGVAVAPILPHLTDAEADLQAVYAAAAEAGAATIWHSVLNLNDVAKESYFGFSRAEFPSLAIIHESHFRCSKGSPRPLARRLPSVIGSCGAMYSDEIILPTTKPETEWIRGRAVQKVSPKRDHSRVQGELLNLLLTWSRGRGEVGPEWRFRIAVAGEPRRPLVPDIAFVRFDRLRGLSRDEIQAPAFAPNVAVEVLSQGDARLDLASKSEVYLRAGCELVIVADPKTRTIAVHDGRSSTTLGPDDTFRHAVLPGFDIPLRTFFANALDLPKWLA